MSAVLRALKLQKAGTFAVLRYGDCREVYNMMEYLSAPYPAAINLTSTFDHCPPSEYVASGRYLSRCNSMEWPNLKMLLPLIEFLGLCVRTFDYADYNSNLKIVYLGGSPGLHIIALSLLFPMATFHIWDDRPWHPDVIDYIRRYSWRFWVYNKKLTLEQAIVYKKYNTILIYSPYIDDPTQTYIDMIKSLQENCKEFVKVLNPVMCCVAYSSLYTKERTNFYSGIMAIPSYYSFNINDAYIFFTKQQMIDFDNDKYNKQCEFARKQLRNAILSPESTSTVQWIERGVQRSHVFKGINLEQIGGCIFDNWRLIQIYFHAYLSLERVKFKDIAPVTDIKEAIANEVLITHNITVTDDMLKRFPDWFNSQVQRIESVFGMTFLNAKKKWNEMLTDKLRGGIHEYTLE